MKNQSRLHDKLTTNQRGFGNTAGLKYQIAHRVQSSKSAALVNTNMGAPKGSSSVSGHKKK
jgi:hypothetical protein